MEHEEEGTESCLGENERIAKYRNLLTSIAQSEEAAKKGKSGMEMEVKPNHSPTLIARGKSIR